MTGQATISTLRHLPRDRIRAVPTTAVTARSPCWVCFTPTGLLWLEAFRRAVAQAEAEFRAEVGDDVATVVALGLEAYGNA